MALPPPDAAKGWFQTILALAREGGPATLFIVVVLVVYVILFLAALAGLSTGLPGVRPR